MEKSSDLLAYWVNEALTAQDLPCISLSNLGCFLDSNWPQWRHAFPGSIQLRQVIESVLLREFFGFCLYLSPSHNSHPEYYVGREELPKDRFAKLLASLMGDKGSIPAENVGDTLLRSWPTYRADLGVAGLSEAIGTFGGGEYRFDVRGKQTWISRVQPKQTQQKTQQQRPQGAAHPTSQRAQQQQQPKPQQAQQARDTGRNTPQHHTNFRTHAHKGGQRGYAFVPKQQQAGGGGGVVQSNKQDGGQRGSHHTYINFHNTHPQHNNYKEKRDRTEETGETKGRYQERRKEERGEDEEEDLPPRALRRQAEATAMTYPTTSSLTFENLQKHDKQFRELRQFGCARCNRRTWWKVVPQHKPVSTCKRCRTRYDAIPPERAHGYGTFDCSCGHRWTNRNSKGNLQQQCRICGSGITATSIQPPRRNPGMRQSDARHACEGCSTGACRFQFEASQIHTSSGSTAPTSSSIQSAGSFDDFTDPYARSQVFRGIFQ